MNAYVVLGCDGRQIDGFKFCRGVKNNLVDLEFAKRSEKYLSLIEYLDKVVGLFDKPCCTNNIIVNAVFKMYEMGFIEEKIYKSIAHFYSIHKMCGMVLFIKLKE